MLVAAAFIAGGFFVLTNAAFAQTTLHVAVDADAETADGSSENPFPTIQAAIEAAAPGDTIQAAAGTYDEQLVIGKQLTLAGIGQAVLQPTFTPAGAAHFENADIWLSDAAASGTVIQGFTLDFNGTDGTRPGWGILIGENINTFPGLSVTDVAIRDNDIQMGLGAGGNGAGQGLGITTGLGGDSSGLVISGNAFHGDPTDTGNGTDHGAEGIYINPNGGAGPITISGNTFDQHLFVGISVEADNVTVSGNTVTRAAGADVSGTHGIRVNDFIGGATYNLTASGNTVSGFENGFRLGSGGENGSALAVALSDNAITGNDRGIWVRYDAAVTASGNRISGNTSSGAEILPGSDGTLDAAGNWWGSASGPVHPTNGGGTGDAVSDGVGFRPWYSNEETTATRTHNVMIGEAGYESIQDAIDAASEGDVVLVLSGIFSESITLAAACGNETASLCIDKSLILRGDPGDAGAGPGPDAPVLDGAGLGDGSAIALGRGGPLSNVTIEGLVIRNYTNPESQGGVGSGVIAWNTETSGIAVRDNAFEDLGWNGVLVGSDDGSVQTGWTVQRNVIRNAAYAGVELTNVADSAVSGNEITVSGGNWDAGDSGVGIEVAVRDHGAGVTAGTNVTVSGNTVNGGGAGARAGINLLSRAYQAASGAVLTGVTVKNNIISGVAPRGILVAAEERNGGSASLSSLQIEGNEIADNETGVSVGVPGGTDGSYGVTLRSNSFSGNGAGLNNTSGAAVDAAHNYWGAASGPSGQGAGDGDSVSSDAAFRPWLLEEGGEAYDQTIALTSADEWALVSAPAMLSEAPAVVDDGAAAVGLLVYLNGAFSAPAADNEDIVKPVSAFYVKTTNKGGVGFKLAGDGSPSQTSKQLTGGWNLVGTNHAGSVQDEFATIQNTEQTAGMVALHVPDVFNARRDLGHTAWGSDANKDLNANPITALPEKDLSTYDGYWVFMDAAKAFVKQL